jgi:hypothetical protein
VKLEGRTEPRIGRPSFTAGVNGSTSLPYTSNFHFTFQIT